jgi:branched-chain amino acid transport system substrate-binding protein
MQKRPPIVYVLGFLALFLGWRWLLPSPSAGDRLLVAGERSLFAVGNSPAKQAATEAFQRGDWQEAQQKFTEALKLQPNDPEATIYSQNASIQNQPSISIAVVVPIGSNPNVANEILRGVATAQIDLNQRGGIAGKKLRVYIADDENLAEKAEIIAQEVVTRNDIIAVVGSNASEPSLAAAKIYQASGVVAISPTASTPKLSGFGKYIFRTTPPSSVTAKQLARYVFNTAKKRKIVLCLDNTSSDNSGFIENYRSEFLSLGGMILPLPCLLGTNNFNPSEIVASSIQNGADGIVIAPHIQKLPQATDLIRANRRQLALFASPSMYTSITLELAGKDANGTVLPVLWHPDTPESRNFSQIMKTRWKGQINWRSAMAYDATLAISSGSQKCLDRSSIVASRDCLADGLRSPSFGLPGAGQPLRFNSQGDREMNPIIVQIAEKNGRMSFDLVK